MAGSNVSGPFAYGVIGVVAGVTIGVGAETSNAKAITLQLTDVAGVNITSRQAVELVLLADANGDAFQIALPTGPLAEKGLKIGVNGALSPLTPLSGENTNRFKAISEANGTIDLTWTDTTTVAAYLGVVLPNGTIAISAALTCA